MKKFVDINPFTSSDKNTANLVAAPNESRRGKFKKAGGWLLFFLLLALLWKLLVLEGVLPLLSSPTVDKNKWQAVFLTSGQIYFGHLQNKFRDYPVLKDAYYFQASQPSQSSTQVQQQLNLVKLETEIHGPENTLYITKEQILFWENLKADSPVAQIINRLAKDQK